MLVPRFGSEQRKINKHPPGVPLAHQALDIRVLAEHGSVTIPQPHSGASSQDKALVFNSFENHYKRLEIYSNWPVGHP